MASDFYIVCQSGILWKLVAKQKEAVLGCVARLEASLVGTDAGKHAELVVNYLKDVEKQIKAATDLKEVAKSELYHRRSWNLGILGFWLFLGSVAYSSIQMPFFVASAQKVVEVSKPMVEQPQTEKVVPKASAD